MTEFFKELWRKLLGRKKNYAQIVSTFSKIKEELEDLALRSKEEIAELKQEAEMIQMEIYSNQLEEQQAKTTIENITKLIGV